jgi:hypothetical protein
MRANFAVSGRDRQTLARQLLPRLHHPIVGLARGNQEPSMLVEQRILATDRPKETPHVRRQVFSSRLFHSLSPQKPKRTGAERASA